MEKALVRYRVSDKFVIGTWRGSVARDQDLPVETDPAFGSLEITLAQYEELATKGLRFGREPRFKVVDAALVEENDPRPRLRFMPTSVRIAVGSAPPSVTVTRLDRAGRKMSTTGTLDVTMLGSPVSLALTSGVAELTIPTGEAKSATIGDGPDYTVESPLEITIFSANTLRL